MRLLASLLLGCLPLFASAADVPVRVPDGFVVEQVAGPELANDIYTMTIDAKGRIAVAGRGYVRQLVDGKALDLVTGIKDGPMGLMWEGDAVYTVVDGGLWKHTGGQKQLLFKVTTGGEHHAHAIRRGADGLLYLLCGNNSGVNAKMISDAESPVKNPIAGTFLRMDDSGGKVAVIADGFRNAYDFDFDLKGVPHTFDSDNERCIGLPWYEYTRFYAIKWGGNYGWLNPQHAISWRKPPYYPDVVKPLATVGRGSPTACVCYRHTQFPKKYQGGFFLADWTFGKIWFVPEGGQPEVFLEPKGDSGFAPTAMAVHPITGELFISIGGRGTRGGVFKVKAKEGPKEPKALAIRVEPTAEVKLDELANVALVEMQEIRERQLRLGDFGDPKLKNTVWEGYSLRLPLDTAKLASITADIRARFPFQIRKHKIDTTDLNRELSRTLAALADDDPATVTKMLAMLTPTSDPIEDVHYLIVLGRLTGTRNAEATSKIAEALVTLDAKYEAKKIGRDTHWVLRLSELVPALFKHDSNLEAAILKHPKFGQAHHAWLAPLLNKTAAAKRVLEHAKANKDYEWTPQLVSLLEALPDAEVRPLLPMLVKKGGLIDALIPLFARSPKAEDRAYYLAGLQSYQVGTVKQSAKVLLNLPADESELLPAIKAMRRLGDSASELEARNAVSILLQIRTGKQFTNAKDWVEWFSTAKPMLAKQLTSAGFDAVAWKKRAAAIAWDTGDVKTGKAVFAKANCAACHNGAQAIGPSLEGVTTRFSREDLLTAIIDPNKDVSARYRTTEINTKDGKSYRGVMIYDAPDGIILHVGSAETVRIAGDNIETERKSDTSLMPAGLMDNLTDREVSDLIAYLRSLKN